MTRTDTRRELVSLLAIRKRLKWLGRPTSACDAEIRDLKKMLAKR